MSKKRKNEGEGGDEKRKSKRSKSSKKGGSKGDKKGATEGPKDDKVSKDPSQSVAKLTKTAKEAAERDENITHHLGECAFIRAPQVSSVGHATLWGKIEDSLAVLAQSKPSPVKLEAFTVGFDPRGFRLEFTNSADRDAMLGLSFDAEGKRYTIDVYRQGNVTRFVMCGTGPINLPKVAATIVREIGAVTKGQPCPKFTIRQWASARGVKMESYFVLFQSAPGVERLRFNIAPVGCKPWVLEMRAVKAGAPCENCHENEADTAVCQRSLMSWGYSPENWPSASVDTDMAG